MLGLHNQINTLKQNGPSIADYYHKLNAFWKQYDAMIELPKCVCNASKGFKKHNQLLKLMQFLMGLDDSYMQIRSSFLSRETLPDVRSAYATISSEESYRVAVGSIAGSSQRNQTSALIIGYPADFGKKKSGQNFKKQSVSNNNSDGKSSSSGFTDEQVATLISLIKDNKVRKNVQADMAVGHPNGTEAYISKIENLRLSNGLTLYDDLNLKNVLGIGEQCGGMYYYSDKGIKSNTSTLNFQCMLSQHDWHYRLGHPEDPVLNDFEVGKNDSTNALQDVNHINFFDIEYPEIPNDYERVANDPNKGKSDSSSSSKSGSNINTVDFPVDSGNDADSSNDFVATQNEEVATL
ncbi:hypothetical protein Tco_0999434, partial [Tanacetum coccineum]